MSYLSLVVFFLSVLYVQAFFTGLPKQIRLVSSVEKKISPRYATQFTTSEALVNDGIARFYNRDLIKATPSAPSTLTIFVIDLSMPGGTHRISATRGAIASLLPQEKIAVIGCYRGGAEVKLPPTRSSVQSMRALLQLQKSVMGNLGAGLELAVETAQRELENGSTNDVRVVILADTRAHGLKVHSSDCDLTEICDIELLQGAQGVLLGGQEWGAKGKGWGALVIDTALPSPGEEEEWSQEGATLAKMCGASYYHAPEISSHILVQILKESKQLSEEKKM